MRAVSEMPSKKGKFLSRVRNDLTRQAENNMKRAFMKAVRMYFAHACEAANEAFDLSSINNHGALGPNQCIEGMVFCEYGRAAMSDKTGNFFAEVGKRLRSAEEVYHRYVCREGEHYVVEYNLLLKALERDF